MEGTPLMGDALGSEWTTVLLLGVLAVLAWTNRTAARKWRVLARGLFRMRLGRQLMREEIDLQDRSLLVLLGVSVLVLGLFGWQAGVVFAGWKAGFGRYLAVAGMVALAVAVRFLVLRLCGFLFQADGGIGEYLYTIVLLLVATALAVLPVVVVAAYRPEARAWVLPLGGALAGAFLLFRWTRALWIGVGESVPLRYLLLYLCAAEVMPALLVMRTL